jgi:hypothetical protein
LSVRSPPQAADSDRAGRRARGRACRTGPRRAELPASPVAEAQVPGCRRRQAGQPRPARHRPGAGRPRRAASTSRPSTGGPLPGRRRRQALAQRQANSSFRPRNPSAMTAGATSSSRSRQLRPLVVHPHGKWAPAHRRRRGRQTRRRRRRPRSASARRRARASGRDRRRRAPTRRLLAGEGAASPRWRGGPSRRSAPRLSSIASDPGRGGRAGSPRAGGGAGRPALHPLPAVPASFIASRAAAGQAGPRADRRRAG